MYKLSDSVVMIIVDSKHGQSSFSHLFSATSEGASCHCHDRHRVDGKVIMGQKCEKGSFYFGLVIYRLKTLV